MWCLLLQEYGVMLTPSQVGSLFTYGLGHIHSDSLHSYQVIESLGKENVCSYTAGRLSICGLLTVAHSFVILDLMPDSPVEAKYLSQREKVDAVERLRANQQGTTSRKWRWDHVWEVILDVKT